MAAYSRYSNLHCSAYILKNANIQAYTSKTAPKQLTTSSSANAENAQLIPLLITLSINAMNFGRSQTTDHPLKPNVYQRIPYEPTARFLKAARTLVKNFTLQGTPPSIHVDH